MKKPDALRIIRKVKDLLSTRNTWCQGDWAKNTNNQCVRPESDDACQWCLMGAVRKIRAEEEVTFIAQYIYDYLAEYIPDDILDGHFRCLALVNDSRGFEAVHSVLDNAIKNLSR